MKIKIKIFQILSFIKSFLAKISQLLRIKNTISKIM